MGILETDIFIVGAGPCGIAAGCAAQRAGFRSILADKGSLLSSLREFPDGMRFYSTADLLEIDGVPFPASEQSPKPERDEAIHYFAAVARARNLQIYLYRTVFAIEGAEGDFTIRMRAPGGGEETVRARFVIVATGAFEVPRMLQIPGETLPHVSHYFHSPLDYYGMRTLIIGGRNSAAEAALALARANVNVTISYRKLQFDAAYVKYWILPDLLARGHDGKIRFLMGTEPIRITSRSVEFRNEKGVTTEDFDRVVCLTGYGPNAAFLKACGIEISGIAAPIYNPITYETSRRGVFVAGTVCSGFESGRHFIENGRFHGGEIMKALAARK
ncbi:MAG: NAD(P)-binding domain-containing protein [Planctomycetota bacterium]